MRGLIPTLLLLVSFKSTVYAAGIGEARSIPQYSKVDYSEDHSTWHRSDNSALEVRTINGFGPKAPTGTLKDGQQRLSETKLSTPNFMSNTKDRRDEDIYDDIITYDKFFDNIKGRSSVDLEDTQETDEIPEPLDKFFKTKVAIKVLLPKEYEKFARKDSDPLQREKEDHGIVSRIRRDAEPQMEKISGTKNVREARLSSPDSWSKQPISVEFRHRTSLEQAIQSDRDQEDPASIEPQNTRGHQAPHTDFVTSQHRRYYPEGREMRDMPMTRNYDDYDTPWYRNSVRERDYYDLPILRRGYRYPDRYRTERDYYVRPYESPYYYDRYRDDDLDLYGRTRPTIKPKRIIYYATLPEVVRKPVDMRNYPRPYESSARPPTTRDTTYKRIPGNVDPNRYRYRQPYDTYESYSKRSSHYDGSYPAYPEDDVQRKNYYNKDSLRQEDTYPPSHERKLANQVSAREEINLPWPVQIGTEVSVKGDERIPGRKIFGESNGYERIQSAQLQKATDEPGPSETRVEN